MNSNPHGSSAQALRNYMCFDFYHGRRCTDHDDQRCPYAHSYPPPGSLPLRVFPPRRGEARNHECTLPLCPLRRVPGGTSEAQFARLSLAGASAHSEASARLAAPVPSGPQSEPHGLARSDTMAPFGLQPQPQAQGDPNGPRWVVPVFSMAPGNPSWSGLVGANEPEEESMRKKWEEAIAAVERF
ncbi:hypothetical protein BDY21DRAFT_377164 [Lineolata rhizophorae]|uniref:C3H1-type domain-containing protein n=1 Tax=Lineolata rhizophorae TaxID=578093 RepID=A0A6A6P959_9PEZI|nr:hypothetical protein BDY21DRAFT_377164 [Lineolata rhizophorae]